MGDNMPKPNAGSHAGSPAGQSGGAGGQSSPLGANSVGASNIQNDAIRNRHIRNGEITKNKLAFDLGVERGALPVLRCPEGAVSGTTYQCPANTGEAPNDNEFFISVVGNTAMAFDTELGIAFTHDLTEFSWGSATDVTPSSIDGNRLDNVSESAQRLNTITASTLVNSNTTLASLVPSVSAGGFVALKYNSKVVITNSNEIYEASTSDLTSWTGGSDIAVDNRGSIPVGIIPTAMDKNFAGAPSGLVGYSIAYCGTGSVELFYLDGTTWKFLSNTSSDRGIARVSWSEADPIGLRDITLTDYTFKTSVGGVSAGQISFPSSAGNKFFFGRAKAGDEILFARFFREDFKLTIQKDANNYIEFRIASVSVSNSIFQATASVIDQTGTIAADDTVSVRSHGANPDWSDVVHQITDSDTLIPTAKSLRDAVSCATAHGSQSSAMSSFNTNKNWTVGNFNTGDLFIPAGTTQVFLARTGVDNFGSGTEVYIGVRYKFQARYKTSKTGTFGSWADITTAGQSIDGDQAVVAMNKLRAGSNDNDTHHADVSLPCSQEYSVVTTQNRWYQFRFALSKAHADFANISTVYGSQIDAIAIYSHATIEP